VSESATHPLLPILRWLAQNARFPGSRLPVKAETLLLLAAAAQTEEVGSNQSRFLITTRDGAKDSALRAHAMRRSLAHYKCDNGAKV
jgi:hypothetical protein